MATTARVLCIVAVLTLGGPARPAVPAPFDDDGNASAGLVVAPPNHAVQAAFTARSYAPGSIATLALRGRGRGLTIRIFHAGAGHAGPLQGAPVARVDRTFTVGRWPSGLYYADVATPGRGDWYAPFIVRPKRLGEHRVAVVLPTNTWQAYNFEDRDSWYLDSSVHSVDLTRPFIDGGVPPHYTGYDRGFIRWLTLQHHAVDFLSDDDLDRTTGDELARAYDLVVFSGHEEYVTEHEFDAVGRYRDLGGNLAFLSANNFFYKVVKHGDAMDGRWRWRDLGRPEASLVGEQYVDWNHAKYANEPYVANGGWVFAGTGVRDGATFGKYGIEVDATSPASPKGTRVLAHIDNIFGHGVDAQMTYYTTPTGAKVFAAGVMNFGGSALWPVVRTMMANIWSDLSRP